MTRDPLYFIALMPPEHIRQEIESFKIEIQKKFGLAHALKLPAHLTLKIPFRINEEKLEELLPAIDKFWKNQKSFEIELDGFGRFGKQVIFVNVQDHRPLITLHEDLLDIISRLVDLKKHEIASKIYPHLTIATRDLKRTDFPQIWEMFENRLYNSSFEANEISIFRHDGKLWNAIQSFQLS